MSGEVLTARGMGDYVPLVSSTPVEDGRAKEPTLLVRDERCADCRWPSTCETDQTCWKEESIVRNKRREDEAETRRGLAALLVLVLRAEPDGDHELPPTQNEEPDVDYCKIPDCNRPAYATRGRYGGLCAQHKDERIAANRKAGTLGGKLVKAPPASEPTVVGSNGQPDLGLVAVASRAEAAMQAVVVAKEELRTVLAEFPGAVVAALRDADQPVDFDTEPYRGDS